MAGSERARAVHAASAYWVHLLGEPPIASERRSTTISIPERQLFSPAALVTLLERSGRGEGIDTRLEEP